MSRPARRGRAQHWPVLALALFAVVALVPSAAGQDRGRHTRELALLLTPHVAMSKPGTRGVAIAVVQPRRPITNERTTLPVLGHATGRQGVLWLEVVLPGRPNGHTGWIRKRGTAFATTRWRLVVHTAGRRVTVYRDNRAVRSFRAVVGKTSTPTPTGNFFVEESIELGPGDVGAPYALALSARSNVFQEFAGGPGQIALHGLENVGGTLGTAVSHGCVRLANDAMRWLATRIGPGVPVTIMS